MLNALREAGHLVYDFRNPEPGNTGFQWSAVDPEWKGWDPATYRDCLKNPVAEAGFSLDMNALEQCDACVLLLPSGRSAHLEAGFAAGAGKLLFVLMEEPQEPELMYAMAEDVCLSVDDLLTWLDAFRHRGASTVHAYMEPISAEVP
ncbi:hypothetical protein [Fimbriimonas ginsengisoli]|uniref:Nucleoside 2-deoxyribosyltransferase n=1 Tax=Fimbriimonas ginsengisoli Gsoil 348 TaxID=661478 RepID=A0A068NJ72_FIMGI|nr:hypothetical protein [Fimbriimonas ginsengisoli]AIE83507.1 hypothetical protein OP10G_0139 [Fimbriimonas ginsengisoli Gsoil 348]